MIASPWGTSATSTAAAWTTSPGAAPRPMDVTATTALTAMTRTAVVAIRRSTSRWSGVRSTRPSLALVVNRLA